MLKRCLLVCVLAACGGAKAAPAKPAGGGEMFKDGDGNSATTGLSECDVMAGHVADVVVNAKEPPPASREVVHDVLAKACKRDSWSADSIKCFDGITDAGGGELCAKQLTEDQKKNLKADAGDKFKQKAPRDAESDDDADDQAEGKMGGRGKPAPVMKPPPPKGGSSGSKGPVKSNDPCEGGE